MDERKVAIWFYQVCCAIQYMHEKRMLHRDIKSANILIDSNGDLKVADLGQSKTLAENR